MSLWCESYLIRMRFVTLLLRYSVKMLSLCVEFCFDKTESANWKVPWHQDVTIAVKSRVEVDGFGPWSTKKDVLHVQPPDYVLEKMLSVRIHLDDCPATNGALRVIRASHRNGKLAETAIEKALVTAKP